MELERHIKELAACEPKDAPFISLYLDTRPTGEPGKHPYEIFLKNRLHFFQREFEDSGEREVQFKQAWERIATYLEHELQQNVHGVALFSRAQPEDDFFLALEFPRPFENRFVVDSVPHIFPLVQFLDHSHHYLVMVSDSEKAKLFEIQFGSIQDVREIERSEAEKSFRGEWAQMHYQNWKKDQTKKFVKQKVKILTDLMEQRGIRHLILAGDEVTLAQIKKELPKWVQDRVVDFTRLDPHVENHAVLRQTLETFANYERNEQLDTLAVLRRELYADGLGVVGTEPTVEALNAGQVDRLIMAEAYQAPPGWRCQNCESLYVGPEVGPCKYCGQTTFQAVDLREELIRKTVLSGARVETIAENPWFVRQGGVGALLRFR